MADEILQQSCENFFAIQSEHQLCRRFNVSRVTVRLALSDLEAKGLIFRRQGKGTFAYGQDNRIQRSVGMVLRKLPTSDQWPIAEMIRGFQAGAAKLRANVLLTHSSPHEWSSETIRSLDGVLLFPNGLSRAEVDFVGHIKMPWLMAWETKLPGYRINFEQKAAARVMAERMLLGGHERIALIIGFEHSLDLLKREGVFQAFESIGMLPQQVIEYCMTLEEESVKEIVDKILHQRPRLTALIVADDGMAFRLIEYLHSHTNVRVPEVISVASFHRSPFLDGRPRDLSTVEFEFFEGGKRAAEALIRASLTNASLDDIDLPGLQVAGNTIAGSPGRGATE